MPGSAAFIRIKREVMTLVRAVPAGSVTTYGAIGECLDVTPRQVAYVLAMLSEDEAGEWPWHRVVAAGGKISTMEVGSVGREQIRRLRREGLTFRGTTIVGFDTVFHLPIYRRPKAVADVVNDAKRVRRRRR